MDRITVLLTDKIHGNVKNGKVYCMGDKTFVKTIDC